jgi:hypothetical protein
MIRDDRKGRDLLGSSLKVEGGKDNWVKSNVLGNGFEAPAGVATLEGNRP